MFKKFVVFLLVASTVVAASAQTDEQGDAPDWMEAIRELRSFGLLQFQGDASKIKDSQQRRIELADQILSDPSIGEPQRIYATISRLQSYGVLFSISYRNADFNTSEFDKYAELIDEGLDDSAKEVVLEAKTAGASFYTGLFTLNPTEENAEKTVEALKQLKEFEPQLPLLQSTRRLMLEQIWKTKDSRAVFEKMKAFDGKMAAIVLNQMDGKTPKNEADFLWDKHFAKLDELISMRKLAARYESGDGTRKNLFQASRWYNKLAKVGDLSASIKVADFYLAGKGFSKDQKTAVKLYREAAKTGSRVAQFKLALCYLNGQGVDKSEENWERWIKTAAENAQPIEVQNIYLTIDFAEAADSYRVFYESLVKQYPDDIFYLNNLAYSLLISSEKDPQKSLELIEKAIEQAPDDFTGMSNFVDTKATALKQLGKTQEAVELFESVLDDIDDKTSILKSLVECYETLGSDKAELYRQRLIEIQDKSDS